MSAHAIIHGNGHARYFRLVKCKDSGFAWAGAAAELFRSPGWNKDYPRIQILTIEELLGGAEVMRPPTEVTFKQAQRVQQEGGQMELGM